MDINQINVSDIKRIYSGRSGCMCGCRGKYTEGKGVSRIFNNMKKFIDATGVKVEEDAGDGIVFVDDGVKTYVIYTKE